MENLKRSVKRLITRLVVIGLVVICGAIAIAQANKERALANTGESSTNIPGATALNDAGNAVLNGARTAIAGTNAKLEETSNSVKQKFGALRAPDMKFGAPKGHVETAKHETTDSFAGTEPFAQREPFSADEPFATQPAQNEQAIIKDTKFTEAQALEDVSGGNLYNDTALPPEIPDDVGTTQAAPIADRFQQFDAAAENTTAPALFNNGATPSATQPKLQTRETSLPFEYNNTQNPALKSQFTGKNQNATPTQIEPPQTGDYSTGDSTGNYSRQQFGQSDATVNSLRSGQPSNSLRSTQVTPVEQPRAVGPPPAEQFQATPPNFRGTTPATPSNVYGAQDYSTKEYGEVGYGATATSGAGRPGPSEQEGPQNTGLMIHKIAPRNVRVGEPATFEIKVRNNSRVPVERVLIRDEVPVGTEVVNTNPQAERGAKGGLLWRIGTLRPNEDVVVRVQVTPMQEGIIGSVASVTAEAFASAQAKVTKPQLKITHTTKEKVLVGDVVRFEISIENPGTGPATNVIVEEAVPAGLSHSKGPKLEYEVGTIPAGGRRRLELTLKAAKAGMVQNVIVARSPGGLEANHKLNLQVVAPQLQIKIDGPTKRYLERKATYSVAIENPGTADAKNVEITAQLPRGLKFVSTNNSGRYDPLTNSIRWTLAKLPARQFGTVQFTGLPTTKGSFNISARANADNGLKDSQEHPLAVEGLAALMFEVKDNIDPIEVGGETTYQIRVRNQGTEAANNVSFIAMVPDGMRPISAEGPTNYRINGNDIVFEAIDRLPAKGESTYNVRVAGLQENDHRFTVKMMSDSMKSPVVEEESTRVYSDK